ncbi:MAG: hypothetical protein RR795_07385, partial [Cetobacterium sp.]|uniref:hypothetical protein n=1 Tax=Cetobacterium sp. TaxID=2071632 RepID=UPI002FC59A5F
KKIILEFIKKWLTMKCLNTVNSEFAILGLTDGICNEFGIKIPSAIIANVLRDLVRIKSLEFIYHKKVYKVKIELKIESDKLELFHKESEDIQSFLFRVKKYLEEQTKKEYSIKMVNKILIDYIDNSDNIEEIDETTLLALSKYIIDENKNNNNIFDKFKEGQLFISAITYENDFCNEDLLNSELIIYLDTEILFNALGYNGIPYLNEFNILKELVDFLNAKNTKKIKFKYLPIQKEEIDNIFVSLENNFYNDYSNKIAFLKIIAEAKKPENLPEVKVMFFKRLNGLGIEFYNHSIEVEKEYNLIYDESTKKEIESWAKKTNRHVDEKETLCLYQNVHSKIYKLRNGVNTLKLKELKAIFISGDALTNKISLLEKINLQQKIALSTYMEELITRLWFRSYNNIGNSLKITSTSTKAQIIIQNMLSKKIHSLINEALMNL